jgi:RNA polymerase sigma-70 factor (sigma-E family)
MMTAVAIEQPDALADLEALYREHRTALVRLGALALGDADQAEEVVHDVFARLHRRHFRLDDPDKIAAYLRSAVLNGCRSRFRRRGSSSRATLRLAGERPTEPASPEGLAISAAARANVLSAIRQLPSRQRDCVLLRYYLDLSEAEIARTLGISAGTVKSSTARARQALAPMLEAMQ